MQDKEIFTALINVLHQAYIEKGYNNITLLRAFQPSQQGRLKKPHITLVKLYDKNIGQPLKTNIYRQMSDDFLHRQVQYIESAIMFSAYVNENDQYGYTANDLCNLTCQILQADATLEILGEIGLRPMRFGAIKSQYFENQKDQYEQNPNFELVISHHCIKESTSPAAKIIKGNFA